MADLNTIIKQLTESSIIAQGKLENFIPPNANPKSVEELVAELVKSGNLTPFQATQVKAGKAKALILGNYTILDKIGAGGMGQVFKAQHRRLKRVVALKMLPPSVTKDALAVARFQREVEAAAKLRHPNIVATDDADQAGAVHFLVMEYIDGKDLSAIVKKDGPIPVGKAANYILQTARGLEFAHSKGVVHRDIKPANLLLSSDGIVKILDMGLARIEGDGPAQNELTGTGTIMGTVDYMSPEQALSTKNADHRADIYSLGISLYYLLAGKSAYRGDSAMETLMAHQTQPIPSLQDTQTTVSKQLDGVFRKMVAKRVEDRYQTMSEVVEALEALGYGSSGTLKRGDVASTIDLSSADRKKLLSQTKKKPLGSITEVVASEKSKNLIFKIVGGSFGTIIAPILVFYLIRHLDKKDEPPAPPAAATPATTVQPVATNTTSPTTSPVASGSNPPNSPWNTPKFQAWMQGVQAMPAAQQVIAVKNKLVELNPGFDGKATPIVARGMVTGLDFVTEHVTDISPVRALAGLQSLTCNAAQKGNARSELFELAPLVGLKLTKLECASTEVFDLSPLHGMPLEALDITKTKVTELSPLDGLPLTTLNMSSTKVTDLSPLQRLPLTSLTLVSTPVTDLLPLQGLHTLTTLKCEQCRQLADFSPLADCTNLTLLKATSTKLTPAGVAALQKALPKCKIEWDEDTTPTSTTTPPLATPPLAVAPFNATQAKAHQAAWAKHLNTQVETTNSVGMRMTLIPPGEFLMGSTPEQVAAARKMSDDVKRANSDSNFVSISEQMPQHKVVVSWPLLMGTTEVTVAQFRQFVETSQYVTDAEKKVAGSGGIWKNPGYALDDDLPVTFVSWQDAVAYCGWLTAQEQRQPWYRPDGKGGWLTAAHANGYRLPTEAEWEHACRAGTTTLYSFGDDDAQLEHYGWFLKNSREAHPVAFKRPNPFGLFDIHGNVVEWCQDWHDAKWYEKSPPEDPIGPTTSESGRVARGGSWFVRASSCLSASRYAGSPNYRHHTRGFRIVRPLDATTPDTAVATTSIPNSSAIKPDPGTAADPVRRLAEWAIAKGGKVKVHNLVTGKGSPEISSASELPKTRFTIVSLMLTPDLRIPDDELAANFSVADAGQLSLPYDATDTTLRKLAEAARARPGGFPKLTNLGLSSAMSDDALQYLAAFPSLVTLYLGSNSRFTDAGLKWLEPLTNLRDVNMVGTKVTANGLARLQKALPNCRIEWPAKGQFYAHAPSAKKLAYLDPAFQIWVADTQKLPAEQQIEAVSKKLMDLNPGFDGKVTPKIVGGIATELTLLADNVTDISPVRALASLKVLTCVGSHSGTKLSDLSPLQGMPLTNLSCFNTEVADLSPIAAANLTYLSFANTSVADLALLRAMPLRNLIFDGAPVTDLSPLQGMSLTELIFTPKNITKGLDAARQMMSLKVIGPSARNQFRPAEFWKKYDAGEFGKPEQPAAGGGQQAAKSKLAYLDPAFQQWVADTQKLSAEKQIEAVSKKLMELNPGFDGMLEGPNRGGTPRVEGGAVTGLWLNTDEVADLSPLRALAGLKRLSCGRTQQSKLADLSPLRGLSLEQFTCAHNNVSDLSPLEGMPLTDLAFSGTKVSDLSPIRGMPLTYLNFQVSPVTDLSPVRGMRLSILNCGGSNVSDLSPIAGMPLVTLITVKPQKITKGIEDLRRITSLQTIGTDGNNTWPAAEFWKRYDAGEFGKPGQPAAGGGQLAAKPKLAYLDPAFQKWVAETQKLSAEQQVEAVSKKLIELNPGFDGKLTPTMSKGVVTGLAFISDNVTDISPVRALSGLNKLNCSTVFRRGKLSDLAPLQGMQLSELLLKDTHVSDLSPLQGMPLSNLECGVTDVNDLSPLRGMQLSSLNLINTKATDISVLSEMPLVNLAGVGPDVADVSPLEGCKQLKSANLRWSKVTAAGVAALQKALPNCKIEWDDPSKPAAGRGTSAN